MAEIEIRADGEVRSNSRSIGEINFKIAWADRDFVGVYETEMDYYRHFCEDLEEKQDKIDSLERMHKIMADALEKIAKGKTTKKEMVKIAVDALLEAGIWV